MELIDYHNSTDYLRALRGSCISNFHMIEYFDNIPEHLYKFKGFGKWNGKQWQEDSFWKDSIIGVLYFSHPADFNKNDPYDSKFTYNKKTIKEKLFSPLKEKYNRQQRREIMKGKLKNINVNNYINRLQKTSRICCFTEKDEKNKFMWNNRYFTSNGLGFCVKYKFNKDIFSPRSLTCLPVAYTNDKMDFTDELCLFMDLVQKYDNHFPVDDPNVIKFTSKANAYTLIKKEQYQEEREWRIFVPNYRYEEYLTIKNKNDGNCKGNFLSAMKAIYINSKCCEIPDWNENYLSFIKNFIKYKSSPQNIDLFYYDEQTNSSSKIQ